MKNNYWDFEDEHDLYFHLVGNDYGARPEQKKDDIQRDKAAVAEEIFKYLKLEPSHVGLEIGSGCGHILSRMAELTQFVYGVDISPSYLRERRNKDVLACQIPDFIWFPAVISVSLNLNR